MTLTSSALSMTVNTLMTGMIVFKILKVFLENNPTSIEQTLGSTGDTKLRNVIFIIVESGMALFAIQLVRVVLSILALQFESDNTINSLILVIGINQMFNVIIRSVHFYFFFVLLITFTLVRASHQQ